MQNWARAGCIIGVILLGVASFGNPPYVFYQNMRLALVPIGFGAAWLYWDKFKWASAISAILVLVHFTQRFGSKTAWLPWNAAMAVALLGACFAPQTSEQSLL